MNMTARILLPFVLLLACLQNMNAARILAFIPLPYYSHQIFYQELWRQLALRGHAMTVVTAHPSGEQLTNLREINIEEAHDYMEEITTTMIKEYTFQLYVTNKLSQMVDNMVAFEMRLPQIQQLIRNKTEHFDLVMIEHIPSLHVVFKHLYDCPMIGLLSMDPHPFAHEIMGNPIHAVLYPSAWLTYQENMSLMERTIAMLFGSVQMGQKMFNSVRQNELIKDVFGEGVPDIYDLFDQTDMMFINVNPVFSPIRPLTPSTINIAGGIHVQKPKPLPKDLREFLDSASNGVIYFSLGSNVKSKKLSLDMRQTLIDTLSQVPCKVLWKYENDTLSEKPANLKTIKWGPQQDILRHPNVRLFITQGGIQSLEESLYSHVPMVVIPFKADQKANAVKVQNNGLGLKVNPHTLTVEGLKSAVIEVLNNPVYRDNVKKLAELIQDEPMPPLEKAVWWTEYVLRHKGTAHLKGPKIAMYQYFYMDVLAFLGVVILSVTGVLIMIIKVAFNCIKKLFGKEKNKKLKMS